MSKTAKIVGAGIAGLTSAIILSKAGYKVKVLERRSDVGGRFSNDFQGIMNWGFSDDAIDFVEKIGVGSGFWKKEIKTITGSA